MAQIRIDTLDKENSSLRLKLLNTETRLMQLENFLTSQGATKEQIEAMVSYNSEQKQTEVPQNPQIPEILPKAQITNGALMN
jgi:hypothetical protein